MVLKIFLQNLVTPNLLLLPICVLAIGLLPLPTPYYLAAKISVFVFGLAIAFILPKEYTKEKIAFTMLAIVYNPIFPVYFGTRLIWWPINLFALYLFWKFRSELAEYEA
jgi:hypothetical protein